MRFDIDYYKNINLNYLNALSDYNVAEQERLDYLKRLVGAPNYSFDRLIANKKHLNFFIAQIDKVESAMPNNQLYYLHLNCGINSDYDTRTNRKIESIVTNADINRQNKQENYNKLQFAAEEIKSKIKIEDIIETYHSPLNHGKCLCPFHNDGNPSLSVNSKQNYFHCFSCGTGGDNIKFVQLYFTLPFDKAVKKIDEDFGLHNLDVVLDDKAKYNISNNANRRLQKQWELEDRKKELRNKFTDTKEKYFTARNQVQEYNNFIKKEVDDLSNIPDDMLEHMQELIANEMQYKNQWENQSLELDELDKEIAENKNQRISDIDINRNEVEKVKLRMEITPKFSNKASQKLLGSAKITVNSRFSFPVYIMRANDGHAYIKYPNYQNKKGEYCDYIKPTSSTAAKYISDSVLQNFNQYKKVDVSVGEQQPYSTVQIVRMHPIEKNNQLNKAYATLKLDNLLDVNCVSVSQFRTRDNEYISTVKLPTNNYGEIVTVADNNYLKEMQRDCVETFSAMRIKFYQGQKSTNPYRDDSYKEQHTSIENEYATSYDDMCL